MSFEEFSEKWADLIDRERVIPDYLSREGSEIYTFKYCEYGDYDNSTEIERANVRCLMETFPGFVRLGKESYGVEYAYIFQSDVNEENLITLISLYDELVLLEENFDTIDSTMADIVRNELIVEAWNEWARQEFREVLLEEYELYLQDRFDPQFNVYMSNSDINGDITIEFEQITDEVLNEWESEYCDREDWVIDPGGIAGVDIFRYIQYIPMQVIDKIARPQLYYNNKNQVEFEF